MNVSVDLGDRAATVLQRLADQIGVTVDQVLSWYVKQQLIIGWVQLVVPWAVFVICMITSRIYFTKACCQSGDDTYEVVTAILFAFCVIAAVLGLILLSPSLERVLVPEAHAVRALFIDLGRLM